MQDEHDSSGKLYHFIAPTVCPQAALGASTISFYYEMT